MPRAAKDRWAGLATEAPHPRSKDLDLLPPEALLRRIAAEDRTAVAAVRRAAPALALLARRFADSIRRGGRVVYAGAGTSGRLGVCDAAELPPTFGLPRSGPGSVRGLIAGGPRALRRSIEGAEDDRAAGARAVRRLALGPGDLLVGISASSLAPYVHGALAAARRAGASTALLTMNRVRRPACAGMLVALETGPEILAGSTRMKAGAATKCALHALSTAAMVLAGKVHGNRMVDLRVSSAKLAARGRRLAAELGGVTPRRAARLLAEAGGEVKTAVVMARRGCGARAARALLRGAGGLLRRALEAP